MNEDIVAAFFTGALLGCCAALAWALHLVERRTKRYAERKIELKITPELAAQITQQVVEEWLRMHGLVWMPRGNEFVWPGEVGLNRGRKKT